jgi:hypothetical protein
MMPLFRQERCAPWAPIRCHADFTSCERQHRLAQHDSHYKIARNYDEDTVNLVEESTLTASKISLFNNSDSSAGNAPIAFECYCYKIEADAP